VAWSQTPQKLGGIILQDALVELCLSDAGKIIAKTIFESRQDVDAVKQVMNDVFDEIEEDVADQMDAMTYRDLIKLHAAVIAHLVETARPLPRMMKFRFGFSQPTLVMAYKLYSNSGRADELRKENRVIHPAFSLPTGLALSS
jgi:prophage DNA circulation protein